MNSDGPVIISGLKIYSQRIEQGRAGY